MFQRIHCRMPFVVAMALISVTTAQARADIKLPIPGEMLEANKLAFVIQSSTAISTAEKRQAAAEFQNVKTQFDQVWKPVEEGYANLKQEQADAVRKWTVLQEKLAEDAKELEGRIHDHNLDKDNLPAADYNRRARKLDDDAKALDEEFQEKQEKLQKELVDREETLHKELMKRAEVVQTWLSGPSLRNFMNRKNRLSIPDGHAMKQLRLADKLGGIRD